jgi:hypothetical protein
MYKWLDYTWLEPNVSFNANLCHVPVQLIWPQMAGSKCIIPFWPMLLGRHTCTRSHLAGTYFILPFKPMLLGRHNCTSDMNKLGRKLMNHSLRQTYLYKWFYLTWQELMHTYAVWLTYLYKWFDHTLQELNLSFHSFLGKHTCTNDLITHGRKLMYHSTLTLQVIRSHLAGA